MIELFTDKVDEAILKEVKNTPLDRLKVFGLSTLAIRQDDEETATPILIDKNGEYTSVFVDDDFPAGIYQRLISKSYVHDSKKGFGDRAQTTINCEILVVCWGMMSETSAEELEMLIFKTLPKEARLSFSDFDSRRVLAGEIQGFDFVLPPEVFLFSSKYIVQMVINQNCI